MLLAEILQGLQVLSRMFVSHFDNWVHLKNDPEFWRDVSHNSPIRDMYAEGRGHAEYLKNSLDTKHVNESMLVDVYFDGVRLAIPIKNEYDSVGEAAKKNIEQDYPNNYTVRYMLDLYWEQWDTIVRVEQFLAELSRTSAYQPLTRSTPVQVIMDYIKNWEQDGQLHTGLGENALRAQLIVALRREGFIATAETHASLGHADIVVLKPALQGGVERGNLLVSECKIWGGHVVLYNALTQLCLYATPNDECVALIIFVTKGSFNDVCEKALKYLPGHPSYGGHSAGVECIDFSLIPAQNPKKQIPATLLLCNLTTTRYSQFESVQNRNKQENFIFEEDNQSIPKTISDFNVYLRNSFKCGPCTCFVCKKGAGNGYTKRHTFDFGGVQTSRRFVSTTASEVLIMLKRAWTSYTKVELNTKNALDLDLVMKFVEADLQERLVPLFIESGMIDLVDGELIFRDRISEYY